MDFFQTLFDNGDHYALHFDISLDDLDFHSRSQFFAKSVILLFIFSFAVSLNEMYCVAVTC